MNINYSEQPVPLETGFSLTLRPPPLPLCFLSLGCSVLSPGLSRTGSRGEECSRTLVRFSSLSWTIFEGWIFPLLYPCSLIGAFSAAGLSLLLFLLTLPWRDHPPRRDRLQETVCLRGCSICSYAALPKSALWPYAPSARLWRRPRGWCNPTELLLFFCNSSSGVHVLLLPWHLSS